MAVLPGYTLIGEFPDMVIVGFLESLLREADIDYVVLDEFRSSWRGMPLYSYGLGVRVLVKDEQVNRAKAIVESMRESEGGEDE